MILYIMRSEILDIVAQHPDTVIVVPTEVVAISMRKAICRQRAERAVLSRQVVSWEHFLRDTLYKRQSCQPIDKVTKHIFARDLARRHSREKIFSALIPQKYNNDERTYVPIIEKMVGSLPMVLEGATADRLSPEWRHDLSHVRDRYRAFLTEHNFFEPQWLSSSAMKITEPYHLIWTEIAPRYSQYAAFLQANPLIASSPIPPARSVAFSRYPTVFEECSATMRAIEEALHSGIAPGEIAISAEHAAHYTPYLRSEAERRGVPIAFHVRKSLDEYPSGGLFRRIMSLVRNRYGIEKLLDLMLDPLIPWREQTLRHYIAQRGVDSLILRDRPNNSLWNDVLQGLPSARNYFERLRAHLDRFASAKSASELLRAVVIFSNRFLDSSRWQDEVISVWENSIALLRQFAEVESSISAIASDSLATFVDMLGDSFYAPIIDQDSVAVYPYQVAAGLFCQRHFALNMSNEATRQHLLNHEYLNEALRDRLRIAAIDLSQYYINLYTHSGEEVSCSYSANVDGRRMIAAMHFAMNNAVIESPPISVDDSYCVEEAFWIPRADTDSSAESAVGAKRQAAPERPSRLLPSQFYPWQQEGMASALAGGATRYHLTPEFKQLGEDSVLKLAIAPEKLSPSALEVYIKCPLEYLLSRILSLEEPPSVSEPEEPRRVGVLYHVMLERLYNKIREYERRDGESLFIAERRDIYRSMADEIIMDISLRPEISDPLKMPLRLKLRDIAYELLQYDSENFDQYAIEACEYRVVQTYRSADDQSKATAIGGSIDRLMKNPETGELIIIDYKKSASSALHKMAGDSETGVPEKLQMAFYRYLLLLEGKKVERALYYNLERHKRTAAYVRSNPPKKLAAIQWSDDELCEQLPSIIDDCRQHILSGSFSAPNRFGCASCRFPMVCRARLYGT